MQVIRACLWKEWRDHKTTVTQGATILVLFTLVAAALLPAVDSSLGTKTLNVRALTGGMVALAALVWLAGIASMVLAPDGEKCGPGFLERQPAGLGRIFVAKLGLTLAALPLLCGIAALCTGVVACFVIDGPSRWLQGLDLRALLLPALVFGSATLAFGPLVQRGVLAVAGGPILLVPLCMLWSAHSLPFSELLRGTVGMLALIAAGLVTAALGFAQGRRYLSPTGRPVRITLCAAVPAYGLALLPFLIEARALTRLDPSNLVVHAGTVELDGHHALIETSAVGRSMHLRTRVDLSSGVLAGESRQVHTHHALLFHGLSLRDRLRRPEFADNLCTTTAGERVSLAHGAVCIARADGTTARIDVGYDDLIAMRGDALLLRHGGTRVGERERCIVVDLVRGERFSSPLVDPDGFVAVGEQWFVAEVALARTERLRPHSWSRLDPKDSTRTPVDFLADGEQVLSATRDGALLVLDVTGATCIVDPTNGTRTNLGPSTLQLPRGDAPSFLPDGTQLLLVPHGDGTQLTSLAPGARALGPRIECGLLLGPMHDGRLLATSADRHALVRIDVRRGVVEPLVLTRPEETR